MLRKNRYPKQKLFNGSLEENVKLIWKNAVQHSQRRLYIFWKNPAVMKNYIMEAIVSSLDKLSSSI